MKLLNYANTRAGDHVTIHAAWNNKFRRPHTVKIVCEEAQLPGPAEVISGDVKNVHGVLFGLAEVAWKLGWRPRGLPETLANIVKNYAPKPAAK